MVVFTFLIHTHAHAHKCAHTTHTHTQVYDTFRDMDTICGGRFRCGYMMLWSTGDRYMQIMG